MKTATLLRKRWTFALVSTLVAGLLVLTTTAHAQEMFSSGDAERETAGMDVDTSPTPAGNVLKAEREYVETVSFDFKNVPLPEFLDYLSRKTGRNFLMKETQPGDLAKIKITKHLEKIDWRRALEIIATEEKLVVEDDGRIVTVEKPTLITLDYKTDTDVRLVIQSIAKVSGANILISDSVKGTITISVDQVPWPRVLESVVRTSGFAIVEEKNDIIRIVDPAVLTQQLETKVFPLKYVLPPDSYRPLIKSQYAVSNVTAPTGNGLPAIVLGSRPTGAGGADQPAGPPSGGGSSRGSGGGQSTQAASVGFPVLEAVSRVLSQVGRASYDIRTNSIIVTDIPTNLVQVEQMIAKLDIEPQQVFVDCKFITTSNTDFLEYGMDWGTEGPRVSGNGGAMAHRLPFNMGKGGWEDSIGLIEFGPRPFVAGAAPTINATDILPAAVSPGLANGTAFFEFGVLDFSQLAPTLRFFKNDNTSQVKQAPKLLMLDHQEGTIFVGDTIRYAEAVTASNEGGTSQGVVEARNSPVDTGFQLLVQPHIVRGTDKVILTVIPKQSALNATAAGAGAGQIPGFNRFTAGAGFIDLPQVTTSTLVTKMMVRSGQTAVLGGLVQETETTTKRKWPLLGDIPLIGYLFKYENENVVKENFLVLLSVHIVKNDGDLRAIYTDHREGLGKFDTYYKDETEDSSKTEKSDKVSEVTATKSTN